MNRYTNKTRRAGEALIFVVCCLATPQLLAAGGDTRGGPDAGNCMESNYLQWLALEQEYLEALAANDMDRLIQLKKKKEELEWFLEHGCDSRDGESSPSDDTTEAGSGGSDEPPPGGPAGGGPDSPRPGDDAPAPSIPGEDDNDSPDETPATEQDTGDPPEQSCAECGRKPEQACYTCKEGECGNHCNITQAAVKRSIETSTAWGDFTRLLSRGADKIPYARVTYDDTFTGSQEVGQECCRKCTATTPTAMPYLKTSGEGKVEGKITVVIPGTGGLGDIKQVIFNAMGTKITLISSYTIGVFMEGTISAGLAIEYKQTSCPLDDNCVSIPVGVTIPLAGGLTGRVSGGYEIEEDGVKEKHVQGGKVEGRIVSGMSIKGTINPGENCGPNTCHFGHNGIKAEAEIAMEVDVGLFKESISYTIGHTFVKPQQGPC